MLSVLPRVRETFDSCAISDELTCETIKQVFETAEYLLDPHTAIGVEAGRRTVRNPLLPMVTLATAHPAKFPEAIKKTGLKKTPLLPQHMQDLFEREERYSVLKNDVTIVQKFMTDRLYKP